MVSKDKLEKICSRVTSWYGALTQASSLATSSSLQAYIVCNSDDLVLVHTNGIISSNGDSVPCFTLKHFIDGCLLDRHIPLTDVIIHEFQPFTFRVLNEDAFKLVCATLSQHDIANGRVDLLTQACGIYSFDEVNEVISVDEDEYNSYRALYLQQSKEDKSA